MKDLIALQQQKRALSALSRKSGLKKILLISHQLTTTGSPLVLYHLAKELIQKGYAPAVLSYAGGSLVKSFEDISVPVICGEIYNRDMEMLKNLAARFDKVVVNSVVCFSAIEAIPEAIWWIHEGQNVETVFMQDYPELKNVLQRAQKIFVVSEYAKQTVEKFNPNVEIIRLGVQDYYVPTAGVLTSDRKVKFAHVGDVCECKAQDVLAEAILKMDKQSLSQCEFHFFCKKAGRRYRKLSKQLSKLDNVFFGGLIPKQSQKWQIFSQMDVFVVPSRDESLSLVALEACMLKKPIIVSENVGAKYMVKNAENGYIVQSENPDALKEAIQKMVNQKDVLLKMGEVSRRLYSKNASFDVFLEDVRKIVNLL